MRVKRKKMCTTCGDPKFLREFAQDHKGKYGRKSICRVCVSKQHALAAHSLPKQEGCHPVIRKFLVGA